MSDNITPLNNHAFGNAVGASALERNRVLRNTYMLLAISLLPTVLGAYFGVTMGFSRLFSGFIGFIVLFAGMFGFIYAIKKTQDTSKGVFVLLAFTFFVGLILSGIIEHTLRFRNGSALVMTAFGGTAGVFFAMAALATTVKRDLSGMSKWLFWGVIVLIVASLINIWVGSTAMMAAISTISIAIFSAYMLYDIKQVIDGGETNYISATLAIYLDLVNIFQSLLNLLGIFGGERD
ncbi:MAG: Bax inhibitor-1 family protein [Cytophagales bacterium]|nr:Bax inhibitor-1 family protein [Cytophagales bacterium]